MVTLMVVAESPVDFDRVCTVVDGWFSQCSGWPADCDPNSIRTFEGVTQGSQWMDIHEIPKWFRDLGLPRFGRPVGKGDAGTIGKLLLGLHKLNPNHPEDDWTCLWIRDVDKRRERIAEADAVASRHTWFLPGLPNQAMESWLLALWVPENEAERDRKGSLEASTQRKLPRDAQKFSHKDDGKKAWRILNQNDAAGEKRTLLRAWTPGRANPNVLAEVGLHAFLTRLDQRLRSQFELRVTARS